MFLENLIIRKGAEEIRNIKFKMGLNLIVDNTPLLKTTASGNSVGKTTVLRLIDYCLGGKAQSIYADREFPNKSNAEIKKFLIEESIVVEANFIERFNDESSLRIQIVRNFGTGCNKIYTINGESVSERNAPIKLQKMMLGSSVVKPTFRQIIAKNIRYDSQRLSNAIKVLHPTVKKIEYESLFLFWFGIETGVEESKQSLTSEKKNVQAFLKTLKQSGARMKVEQSLIVVEGQIRDLDKRLESMNVNEDFLEDLEKLNSVRGQINQLSSEIGTLELRKELILQSKKELLSEYSEISPANIRSLYEEALALIPNIQRTFEESVAFHNSMVTNRLEFVTKDLPIIENNLQRLRQEISGCLRIEAEYSSALSRNNVISDIQAINERRAEEFRKQGSLQEQLRLLTENEERLKDIEDQLELITQTMAESKALLNERITQFNNYFSRISNELYGETSVLSAEYTNDGITLDIGSVDENPGTGKKKGQIAAFDLAYIQFADAAGIRCLHFILQDQIESVHGNQLTAIFSEIVDRTNCQYIVSALSDKLPTHMDTGKHVVLTLSQNNKLFGV